MTVKTSISLTESQNAYAGALAAEGRFSSVSAVLQQGLEKLRAELEEERAFREGLKTLLEKRAQGLFLSEEEWNEQYAEMMAELKAEYGLED